MIGSKGLGNFETARIIVLTVQINSTKYAGTSSKHYMMEMLGSRWDPMHHKYLMFQDFLYNTNSVIWFNPD